MIPRQRLLYGVAGRVEGTRVWQEEPEKQDARFAVLRDQGGHGLTKNAF